jgi:hypothetical protein
MYSAISSRISSSVGSPSPIGITLVRRCVYPRNGASRFTFTSLPVISE